MNYFNEMLKSPLQAGSVKILQINTGLMCNQSCRHCHLNCSPDRSETMNWSTFQKITELAREIKPELIDITGGAPELNPHLEKFIKNMTKQGHKLQVRTNLTAMLLEKYQHMGHFFARQEVNLVASVPCYLEENVDSIRGKKVFHKSIKVLQKLNKLGYGTNKELNLDLVFNPVTILHLPPEQTKLQAEYKHELLNKYNIRFNKLLTITNMPIGRYFEELKQKGQYHQYITILQNAFNEKNLKKLMCRHQINISWDGQLYDCDFNQALKLPINHAARHIDQFDINSISNRQIVTYSHCLACTAGFGSSCAGSLA